LEAYKTAFTEHTTLVLTTDDPFFRLLKGDSLSETAIAPLAKPAPLAVPEPKLPPPAVKAPVEATPASPAPAASTPSQ
jgi:hypothetical protein